MQLCYDIGMQLIRSITEKDFGRIDHPDEWQFYSDRIGARAVLINNEGQIALMHVTNRGYYKLPGGGMEKGEEIEETLRRELKEEVGVDSVEILSEIGQIDEYREAMKKRSVHQCFLVKLNGHIGLSEQTDKEIEHGYKTVWAKDIDEAIELVDSGKPQEYGQDFERLRELAFLQYVKNNSLLSEGSINQ
jgi:8-oxo-dGTP diphosphatase